MNPFIKNEPENEKNNEARTNLTCNLINTNQSHIATNKNINKVKYSKEYEPSKKNIIESRNIILKFILKIK